MAIENGGAAGAEVNYRPAATAGAQDSLSEYRSPAQASGIGKSDKNSGNENAGGGTPFTHTDDEFPHPKNTEQAVWESRSIEMNANAALHSKDGKATAAEIQRIADTLKAMSPSERALMMKQLQNIGDAIEDTGKREKNVSSLPDITINRDEKGNVKDITFKSISDDDSYGKSFKIGLNDKTDEKSKESNKESDLGKEQKNEFGDKFTLGKDALVNSYQYVGKGGKVVQSYQFGRDADGNINKITNKDGDVYEKLPRDPESFDINERNGTGWSLSNPKTGMIGRSSVPLGDVTANAKDGVHVDGYEARAALGIARIEHKRAVE